MAGLFNLAADRALHMSEPSKKISITIGIGQPLMGMAGGGGLSSVQKKMNIGGQPHKLAYINSDEASLLKQLGGSGRPVNGVPAYVDMGEGMGGYGSADAAGGGLSDTATGGLGMGGSEGWTDEEADKAAQQAAQASIADRASRSGQTAEEMYGKIEGGIGGPAKDETLAEEAMSGLRGLAEGGFWSTLKEYGIDLEAFGAFMAKDFAKSMVGPGVAMLGEFLGNKLGVKTEDDKVAALEKDLEGEAKPGGARGARSKSIAANIEAKEARDKADAVLSGTPLGDYLDKEATAKEAKAAALEKDKDELGVALDKAKADIKTSAAKSAKKDEGLAQLDTGLPEEIKIKKILDVGEKEEEEEEGRWDDWYGRPPTDPYKGFEDRLKEIYGENWREILERGVS